MGYAECQGHLKFTVRLDFQHQPLLLFFTPQIFRPISTRLTTVKEFQDTNDPSVTTEEFRQLFSCTFQLPIQDIFSQDISPQDISPRIFLPGRLSEEDFSEHRMLAVDEGWLTSSFACHTSGPFWVPVVPI